MGSHKKGTDVIKTSANFFPTEKKMKKLVKVQKTIEKLGKNKSAFMIEPNNDTDFKNVKCISFRKKQNNEPQLVYEVCYAYNKLYLKTGNISF